MKTIIFEKPGLENIKDMEVPIPKINENEVLIKVKRVGINPIDYFTITGFYGLFSEKRIFPNPMPHIPGMEFSGEVEKVGSKVSEVNVNDHVIVYNRTFDSECDQCISGREMLCRKGSLIGVTTNGGLSEYVSLRKENVIRIPKNLDWNLASSLSVSALTAYHALNLSSITENDTLLVYGASGSTGMFAIQFGKLKKAKVIAVSKKSWLKELGADFSISDYDKVPEITSNLTSGKMADVVINSLGKQTWESSLNCLNFNGRLVIFGILTGNIVQFDLQPIYLKQIQIIGSNGGTILELKNIIKSSNRLKVRVWKVFSLEQTGDAFKSLFDTCRDGRIMIDLER
ncbi:MAG: alcohol dehydrogenase catalytic domain-containing protein [Nitrososphaeraceae archaeon]